MNEDKPLWLAMAYMPSLASDTRLCVGFLPTIG